MQPSLPCEKFNHQFVTLEECTVSLTFFIAITCQNIICMLINTPCPSGFFFFARVEQSVYALLRTRDMAISRYREFGIPVDWLLDTGVVGKVCH